MVMQTNILFLLKHVTVANMFSAFVRVLYTFGTIHVCIFLICIEAYEAQLKHTFEEIQKNHKPSNI